jgi:hypothetical protein
MNYDNQSFDENEWTADERAQLHALDAERSSSATLKARTIRALRDEHLLGAAARGRSRLLLVLAAASVMFAAGTAVGYTAGSRRALARDTSQPAASAAVARADTTARTQRATRQVVWF